jgi:hypothetical protein
MAVLAVLAIIAVAVIDLVCILVTFWLVRAGRPQDAINLLSCVVTLLQGILLCAIATQAGLFVLKLH